MIVDKALYQVAAYSSGTPGITNKSMAVITKFKLSQSNLRIAEKSTYTIDFTPVSPMPITGSVMITYPKNVGLTSDFACKIRTNKLFSGDEFCKVNKAANVVVVTGVFAETSNWVNQISVELVGMRNPLNNKPGGRFFLNTY